MAERVALLLLPGMLCDARFWRAQVDGLADVEACIASYGGADSIETMAIGALATAPDSFALAGHSMGGRVAMEIYRRVPQRVSKLALLCTDYRAPKDEEAKLSEAAERDEWLGIARTRGMRAFAEHWLPEILGPDGLGNPALVREIVEMMASHSVGRLAAQTRAGLTRPDYTDLLPEIACPTLVCAGGQDAFRPLAPHREMAARIPGAMLVMIEGSGHMVAMEQPQALTTAMRNWLLA